VPATLRTWQSLDYTKRNARWAGGGKATENSVGFILEFPEDTSSVMLDSRILEIVTLLELMRPSERRQEVATPSLVPILP